MSEFEDRVKASPAAKRLAQEMNIDINKVKGTGADGRIQLSDIENYKPAEIQNAADELTEDDFSDISLTVDNMAIEDDDDFFELRTPAGAAKPADSPVFAFDALGDDKPAESPAKEKPEDFDFGFSVREPEPAEKEAAVKPAEFDFSQPENAPEEKIAEEPVIVSQPAAPASTAPAEAEQPSAAKPVRKSIFDILADEDDSVPVKDIIAAAQKKAEVAAPEAEPAAETRTPFLHIEEEEEAQPVAATPVTETASAETPKEAAPAEDEETAKRPRNDLHEEGCCCGCHDGDDDDDSDDEYDDDDEDFEDDVQPLRITFKVKCENIDAELDKNGLSVNSSLLDTVMKSLAYAIYDADDSYDGRINVVRMSREGLEVRTAADTLHEPVGRITLDDPSEHNDDIFVNVWDMTNFGFDSYSRPDAGMINVFVLMRGSSVKIEMLIDEYAVDLYTATLIAEDFRLNMNRVSTVMNRTMPEDQDKK